mmetsp:Transcript_162172/g.520088  ORF Transcript_162172/g.520088 Transcript_162172/m.520088 type:complete len:284 (+) Transcript_162172:274-1125(+)
MPKRQVDVRRDRTTKILDAQTARACKRNENYLISGLPAACSSDLVHQAQQFINDYKIQLLQEPSQPTSPLADGLGSEEVGGGRRLEEAARPKTFTTSSNCHDASPNSESGTSQASPASRRLAKGNSSAAEGPTMCQSCPFASAPALSMASPARCSAVPAPSANASAEAVCSTTSDTGAAFSAAPCSAAACFFAASVAASSATTISTASALTFSAFSAATAEALSAAAFSTTCREAAAAAACSTATNSASATAFSAAALSAAAVSAATAASAAVRSVDKVSKTD